MTLFNRAVVDATNWPAVNALRERVKELQAQLDARYDHPRCGQCDNEKVCIVHDCPNGVHYSESQFCDKCGKCKKPQCANNGGPCDACRCTECFHRADILCDKCDPDWPR
ncbi:MAG TPA: hypothetical protein V6D22_13725 [Candidatus Obscuribacterales bacterium]